MKEVSWCFQQETIKSCQEQQRLLMKHHRAIALQRTTGKWLNRQGMFISFRRTMSLWCIQTTQNSLSLCRPTQTLQGRLQRPTVFLLPLDAYGRETSLMTKALSIGATHY